LVRYLKERIAKKIPTSFIRLGDGEGNYLAYPDFFQQYKEADQKIIQYIWWKEAKLNRDKHNQQIIEIYRTAVQNADILGVIPEQRLISNLEVCLNNGQLNSHLRGVFGVMHSTMHLPFKAKILTSSHVHTDFEMWDCYHALLKDIETIHVISCHSELVEYIKERFGIKTVYLHQVPCEHKYQKMFGYEESIDHFPTVFEELSTVLPKKSKGQVFLVAAGFLSKIYCHIIKENGGFAMDIGSVVDHWLGYFTRSHAMLGHYANGVRYKELVGNPISLPPKEMPVKTNHYCDKLLPVVPIVNTLKPCTFLITSHPRCGTGYTSQFLNLLGFSIGHERLEAQGLSSWLHAVSNQNTPLFGKQNIGKYNVSRYDLQVAHLLLLVRDPKMAIPSIILENRVSVSYNYRRFHILQERGIDLDAYDCYVEKAIVSYVEWIAIIVSQKPNCTLRLEYIEEDLIRQKVNMV